MGAFLCPPINISMSHADLLPLKDFRISITGVDSEGHTTLTLLASSAEIPGITSGAVPTPYRTGQGFVAGDRIEYEPLPITFNVDDNLEAYKVIHNWIIKNATTEGSEYRDLVVTIFDGAMKKAASFRFVNCFPTTLSGFQLDNGTNEVIYAEMTTTFRYDYYLIE